jgi:hypothetical protein
MNYLPMNSRLVDGMLLWGGVVAAILFTLAMIKVVMNLAEANKG